MKVILLSVYQNPGKYQGRAKYILSTKHRIQNKFETAYYKLLELVIYKSATGITECDDYDKVRQKRCFDEKVQVDIPYFLDQTPGLPHRFINKTLRNYIRVIESFRYKYKIFKNSKS